jgi:hypothetical protein
MNKTTKATLWILGVFAVLSLAVYFAGCSDDATADAGTAAPAACAKEGDKCTGGTCLAETGGTFACYAECTVVGDTCKQTDASDGTCYLYGAKDQFACMATGAKATGEACGTMSDCAAGNQCLDQGGTKNCYLVCTDACDAGDCTDTELGFKVCVAAAEEG